MQIDKSVFVGGDSNMGLFGKKKDEFIKIKVENLIDWKEPNGEGCIVSDKITKEGYKVGYMYREQPDEGRPDSGWRFMAGNEDDEYMNNPNNHHIFAVNTICNYDKDIIPYLHNQSKSSYNYYNDKLHNEGFRLNLYSIPNRPIV